MRRLRDGRRDVAPTEHRRGGEAVDQVHDQQAVGRLGSHGGAEALARVGGNIVIHEAGSLIDGCRAPWPIPAGQRRPAPCPGEPRPRRGAAAAARLVVRTQREQEIALVRPRVHADRGLAVVQPQRGPASGSRKDATYSRSSSASTPPSIRVAKPFSTVSSMGERT
ncbi:hypothetical protein G6F65_020145 [Rhizopus arrhizus]|nr:hypothetical protein G6F65_020145 [Rhizopus arrhizus]